MCPLTIATEVGGCLVNDLDVRPGKFGRKPQSSAWCSVERAGEKRVACAKATNSAGVAECTAA